VTLTEASSGPPLRVTLVIPTLDRGGAEKQLCLLASGLGEWGVVPSVVVLTRDGPMRSELDRFGIQTRVIGKRGKLDPLAYRRLKRELAGIGPDVVHTWLFAANAYGRAAALSVGVPVILGSERCVDLWKGEAYFAIDRYLERRTAGLTTNSAGVRDFYVGHGVAADRIMISATHTHTAPAAMSCLGTDADPEYRAYLRVKVTEAIAAAKANLVPARVGFGSIDARHYMAVRQWVRRPDRIASDPFGNPTVRANMHAGRVWEDVTGEAGPEDPELSMISLQTLQGEPIAVLSNLSMHYFSGVSPISADYFGLYSDALAAKLTGDKKSARPIVGIMSHGCSGDIWRVDYTKQTPPEFETIKIDQYVSGLIELSMRALAEIRYDESPRLEMAETRFRLNYRVPDAQLLQWSKGIVEKLEGKLPTTTIPSSHTY